MHRNLDRRVELPVPGEEPRPAAGTAGADRHGHGRGHQLLVAGRGRHLDPASSRRRTGSRSGICSSTCCSAAGIRPPMADAAGRGYRPARDPGRGRGAVAPGRARPGGGAGPPAALRRLEPAQGQDPEPASTSCAPPCARWPRRPASGWCSAGACRPPPTGPAAGRPRWWTTGRPGPRPGRSPGSRPTTRWTSWTGCRVPGGPGAAQLPARRGGCSATFAAGPPDTVPVMLLRHASAVHKTDWQVTGHDDDLRRPLDPAGGPQAQALAPLLAASRPAGWSARWPSGARPRSGPTPPLAGMAGRRPTRR